MKPNIGSNATPVVVSPMAVFAAISLMSDAPEFP